jgi:hypothetical protein
MSRRAQPVDPRARLRALGRLGVALALAILGLASPAAADPAIETSSKLATLFKPGPQPGVVLFDLDRVVWAQNTSLGSETWYERMGEEHGADVADQLWNLVGPSVDVSLVEPKAIAKTIARLRARGIKVYALTAQYPAMVGAVTRRLARAGITLDVPAALADDGGDPTARRLGGRYAFAEGVIFSNTSGEKATAFEAFVGAAGGEVDLTEGLTFLDDKLPNLDRVGRWAEARGIRFRGIHYTRALKRDARYATPSAIAAADHQLAAFVATGAIPSDAAAKAATRTKAARRSAATTAHGIIAKRFGTPLGGTPPQAHRDGAIKPTKPTARKAKVVRRGRR